MESLTETVVRGIPLREAIKATGLSLGDVRRLSDGRYRVEYRHRDGQPGLPMSSGVLLLDTHPDIRGGRARGRNGQPGRYWELRNLPHVQSALSRPIRALSGTPWRLDDAPMPPWADAHDHAAAKRQRELCERIFWAWEQQPGGFAQYVTEVLWTTLVCGFSWFELVSEDAIWTLESVGFPLRYQCPRLPEWRAPWAIDYWLTDREHFLGVVASFHNATDYSGGTGKSHVVIPREKILHVANEQIGSNFEGRSSLRSVYNFLLMVRQAYQLQALAVEVNSLGELWFKLTGDANLSPAEEAWLERYIKTRKASHVPGGILPPGVEVEYGSPKDRMPDMGPIIEGLERQIALGLDNDDKLIALGKAGSYAAKDVATDESRSSFNDLARQFITTPLKDVLRRFICVNFPHDAAAGRVFVPRIVHGEVEERDTEKWLASVALARETGLLADPEFGDIVREELQLPPRDVDEAEEDVVPEAGLDPAEAVTAARLGGLLITTEAIAWARAVIGMPPMTEAEIEATRARLEAEADIAAQPDNAPVGEVLADEEPDYYGGQWLSPSEIAAKWGFSTSTISSWIKSGKIDGRKIGSQWKAKADAVAAFIADEADLPSTEETPT